MQYTAKNKRGQKKRLKTACCDALRGGTMQLKRLIWDDERGGFALTHEDELALLILLHKSYKVPVDQLNVTPLRYTEKKVLSLIKGNLKVTDGYSTKGDIITTLNEFVDDNQTNQSREEKIKIRENVIRNSANKFRITVMAVREGAQREHVIISKFTNDGQNQLFKPLTGHYIHPNEEIVIVVVQF